jgi:predicted RNase H-like nuclease
MVVGVDGCRGPARQGGGWLLVEMGEDGAFGAAAAVGSFAEVLAATGAADLVLVDIPMGLPDRDRPTRACDREARRLVGPRRSSVFPPPARAALGAAGYAAACVQNREATGRAISRQAWGLAPRIAQVDAALRARPDLQARCREAHPEVGFCALNGWRPLAHPKRQPAGVAERLGILSRYTPDAAAWFEAASVRWPRSAVDATDILDAMVLALTARRARLRGLPTLPVDPPSDACGLRMEMVCPAPLP